MITKIIGLYKKVLKYQTPFANTVRLLMQIASHRQMYQLGRSMNDRCITRNCWQNIRVEIVFCKTWVTNYATRFMLCHEVYICVESMCTLEQAHSKQRVTGKVIITLRPRQNGRHFPDDIFKWISYMQMYEFRLTFHWSLLLGVQLTIFRHWFR